MPALTRRHSPDPHREVWLVYLNDVQIGIIGERAGAPVDIDQMGLVLRVLSRTPSRLASIRNGSELHRGAG